MIVLTSAATRNTLRQMYFRIIRTPVRASLQCNWKSRAVDKNIGAFALVGYCAAAVDANKISSADDTRLSMT